MRKPVLLIFINAMILIIVFALLAQSLLVVTRVAQAEGARGLVEVQRGGKGEFSALSSGQMVAVGDVVRTGQDGQVEFTWADKTRWKLTPNTRLTVAKATTNNANNTEDSRFRLDAGKLFVRIVKPVKEGSTFEVQTPGARARVVGTVFSIAALADGTTRIETYAGRVQMESAGKNIFVPAGQAATSGHSAGEAIAVKRFSGADFRSQLDLIRPALSVRAQPMNKDVIFVRGSTEAGNTLEINGKRALMLNNGSFARRFTLAPGHNEWQIVATDKHGAASSSRRGTAVASPFEERNAIQRCARAFAPCGDARDRDWYPALARPPQHPSCPDRAGCRAADPSHGRTGDQHGKRRSAVRRRWRTAPALFLAAAKTAPADARNLDLQSSELRGNARRVR